MVAHKLVAARRGRVPLMEASPWQSQQPAQACDRCGSATALPYRHHPLATNVPPVWRCAKHKTTPAIGYLCGAYRRPS